MTTAKTRVDSAYQSIYRAILDGEYPPGSKLHSVQLQERYNLSTGVLREVLTRLTGDGFVIAESQRGFRVIEISRTDLEDLTEAQILVETELIRQSTLYGDLDFEAELAAANHRLANTPHDDGDGHTSLAWKSVHREFHRKLLAGARNERLKAIALSLRDQGEIYRSWSVLASVGGDLNRNAEAEHQALMEAVLERDAERAVREIREHAERSRDVLLAATEATEASASLKDKGVALDGDSD